MHTGQYGPVDVLRSKRLVTLFLAKSGSSIDWSLLEDRWDDPLVVLSIADRVHRMEASGRCRAGRLKTERRMRALHIPVRADLEIPVAEQIPKKLAFAELRADLGRAELPPALRQ